LDGEGVEVLASPAGVSNLLAHAACIESRRLEWQAAGLNAVVSVRSATSGVRWRTLTGLPVARGGERPDVMVVDQADRRSAPELLALLADVRDKGATILLVEGGTLPCLSEPRSLGLAASEAGRRRLHPEVKPGAVAHQPAAALLRAWAERYRSTASPVLVGLGVDEVRYLNEAARDLKGRRDEIGGPVLTAKGRDFQTGDRVVVLNGVGAGLPRGSMGTIRDIDEPARRAAVSWDGERAARLMDRSALTHVGHAYAATPALAQRMQAPVLLLGPPEAAPAIRQRVVLSVTAPPYRSLARQKALDLGL
jgi:hypothetical protein